jgi:hypothetical protein
MCALGAESSDFLIDQFNKLGAGGRRGSGALPFRHYIQHIYFLFELLGQRVPVGRGGSLGGAVGTFALEEA